ncbi:MAG: hypothetical protein M0Z49_05605 [Chloroflexi bacterium]|nr:hypothetical protein [Chloroflexota bacterium]
MTPAQIQAFINVGEPFVEGTIAAALVALWLLVVALHLARPYMLATLQKFTLRLAADLWWIIYVALRDLLVVQVFLGSFIFFYPDVVRADNLPITGGLAAACAFAALVVKLTTRGDADPRGFRLQTILLGVGSMLYIVPYVLGVQVTTIGSGVSNQLAALLDSSQNTNVSLPLAYISAAIVGLLGLYAVIYNLRIADTRRPQAR